MALHLGTPHVALWHPGYSAGDIVARYIAGIMAGVQRGGIVLMEPTGGIMIMLWSGPLVFWSVCISMPFSYGHDSGEAVIALLRWV